MKPANLKKMSREIKFRAWNVTQSKMLNNVGVHPDLAMDLSADDEYYKTNEDGRYLIGLGFDNYKVMQYTGLKDKNGKEIYEGDIMQGITGYISTIVFHEGIFCCRAENDHPNKGHMMSLSMVDTSAVIGNIYENPELLK